MQVIKQVDILNDLASSHGADADEVLAELVEIAGDDVLAHHLRWAFARASGFDHPDGPATWESCV